MSEILTVIDPSELQIGNSYLAIVSLYHARKKIGASIAGSPRVMPMHRSGRDLMNPKRLEAYLEKAYKDCRVAEQKGLAGFFTKLAFRHVEQNVRRGASVIGDKIMVRLHLQATIEAAKTRDQILTRSLTQLGCQAEGKILWGIDPRFWGKRQAESSRIEQFDGVIIGAIPADRRLASAILNALVPCISEPVSPLLLRNSRGEPFELRIARGNVSIVPGSVAKDVVQ